MSVTEQLIKQYTELPKLIDGQSQELSIFVDSLPELEFPMPDGFQIDVNFCKEQLIDIDNHCAPSKALFMHMTKIEQALKGWRYNISQKSKSSLTQEKTKQLHLAINDSLVWFKESFISRLYSEVDSQKEVFDEFLTVNVQEFQKSLIIWLQNIELLAGKDFKLLNDQANNLPFNSSSISNAKVHLQRIEQANQRKSKASQSLWLAENSHQALFAFKGKIDQLKTVVSLGDNELEEYRALYRCFQPYITKNRWWRDNSLEVDFQICYALAGSKEKAADDYQSNNDTDIKLFHGLGVLQVFKDKDIFDKLVAAIEFDIEHYQAAASVSLDKQPQSCDVELNILDLINSSDEQMFSSVNISNFAVKYKSFDIDMSQSSSNSSDLFNKLHKLNKVKQDLFFSKQVIESFSKLISKYNMSSSQVITNEDRVRMNKYLQILQMFYADSDSNIMVDTDRSINQCLIELNKFVNEEHPPLGGIYYNILMKIDLRISVAFDDYQNQLEQLEEVEQQSDRQQNLTNAFREELAKTKLITGTKIFDLKVKGADQSLKKSTDEVTKDIKLTFANLSSVILNQISETKLKKLYNSQVPEMQAKLEEGHNHLFPYQGDNILLKPENELDKKPEINGYIYAENSFSELKQVSELLLQSQMETHDDFKDNLLSKAKQLLKNNLDIDNKLVGYSPKLSMLANQLQDFVSLLKLKFPYSLELVPIAKYPLKYNGLLNSVMDMIKLPVQWRAELSKFSIPINVTIVNSFEDPIKTIEQIHFADLYQEFQRIKNEIENNQIDLKFIKNFHILLPKLLATASSFELVNNLKVGCVSDLIYSEVKDVYKNNKSQSSLEFNEVINFNVNFNLIEKAQEYVNVAVINEPDENVKRFECDIRMLEVFLGKLEHLNSFWFTSLPSMNFGFFKINSHMSEYIETQRKVGKLFESCYEILDPSGAIYNADFLNGKSSFKNELPHLISSCQERLSVLKSNLKPAQFHLSILNTVIGYYKLKESDFLNIKKGKTRVQLDALLFKKYNHKYDNDIKAAVISAAKPNFIISEYFTKIFIDELEKISENLRNKYSSYFYSQEAIEIPKDGLTLQDELELELDKAYQKEYEKQKTTFDYYKRLERVKYWTGMFVIYLKNPEWAIESSVTINEKTAILDKISEELRNCNDIDDCYERVAKVIDDTKDTLLKDINPSPIDFVNYLQYWFMSLCRALKALITWQSHINEKDQLVEELIKAVSHPDLLVEQTHNEVLPQTTVTDSPRVVIDAEQNEDQSQSTGSLDSFYRSATYEMTMWDASKEPAIDSLDNEAVPSI